MKGATAVVELEFDAAGDIVRATGTRPFAVGKTFVPTPWGGDFSDYASFNAPASQPTGKRGGSYPRAASSTGADTSTRSS